MICLWSFDKRTRELTGLQGKLGWQLIGCLREECGLCLWAVRSTQQNSVIVSFCQLDINLGMTGKRESQLKCCPHQFYLWACLWRILLIVDVGGPRALWEVPSFGRCFWLVWEGKLSKQKKTKQQALFLHGFCCSSCLQIFALTFCLNFPL